MAKREAQWQPDTEEGPATYPKTRDELVQSNRGRREDEPAAAPQETDSESGSPAAVAPTPRTEPVKTPTVNVSDTEDHEVRAGPGDAGASDTPARATKPARARSDSWGRVIGIVAAVIAIALIISFFMA